MEIREYRAEHNAAGYDIKVDQIGYEVCEPRHFYGPAARRHYLLHYVKSGKGTFTYNGKKIEINKNEIFLILPEEVTFYIADNENPWEYYWFGISGKSTFSLLKAAGFSVDKRKIKYKLNDLFSIDDAITNLTEMKIINQSDKLYETARIYEILHWLVKNSENDGKTQTNISDKKSLVNAAVEYMKRGYTREIAITDVARHIGTDRSQLYRYFMQVYNKSPQQCLIDIRMKEAQRLLKYTNLSVKQIAYSVGYKDQYLFSKMFKKEYNMTPSNYRTGL